MKSRYTRRGAKRAKRTTRRKKYPTYRAVRNIVFKLAETKYFESPLMYVAGGFVIPAVSGVPPPVEQHWSRCALLNMIGQGVSVNQRIGNRIMVKYVQLSIGFAQNAMTTDNAAGTCRYLVVHDKAANKSLAAGSDVFGLQLIVDDDISASTGAGMSSLKNFNNLKRFRFKLDRQHVTTSYAAAVAQSTPQTVIQHYIPIGRTFQFDIDASADPVHFRDNSALVADALNFMIAASSDSCCAMLLRFRVAFKDA